MFWRKKTPEKKDTSLLSPISLKKRDSDNKRISSDFLPTSTPPSFQDSRDSRSNTTIFQTPATSPRKIEDDEILPERIGFFNKADAILRDSPEIIREIYPLVLQKLTYDKIAYSGIFHGENPEGKTYDLTFREFLKQFVEFFKKNMFDQNLYKNTFMSLASIIADEKQEEINIEIEKLETSFNKYTTRSMQKTWSSEQDSHIIMDKSWEQLINSLFSPFCLLDINNSSHNIFTLKKHAWAMELSNRNFNTEIEINDDEIASITYSNWTKVIEREELPVKNILTTFEKEKFVIHTSKFNESNNFQTICKNRLRNRYLSSLEGLSWQTWIHRKKLEEFLSNFFSQKNFSDYDAMEILNGVQNGGGSRPIEGIICKQIETVLSKFLRLEKEKLETKAKLKSLLETEIKQIEEQGKIPQELLSTKLSTGKELEELEKKHAKVIKIFATYNLSFNDLKRTDIFFDIHGRLKTLMEHLDTYYPINQNNLFYSQPTDNKLSNIVPPNDAIVGGVITTTQLLATSIQELLTASLGSKENEFKKIIYHINNTLNNLLQNGLPKIDDAKRQEVEEEKKKQTFAELSPAELHKILCMKIMQPSERSPICNSPTQSPLNRSKK